MSHGNEGGPPAQWSDHSYGRSPGIHPSETWTIYGEDVGFYTTPSHDPVTFEPRHGPHFGVFQDDLDALVYYGSFGLLDPKMPFEAFGIRKGLGMVGIRGLAIGAGISMSAGILLAAVVGWVIDPADKREGGVAEWDWDTYSERRKFG